MKLNTEGVSRGNPGEAGAGYVLGDDCGEWILKGAINLSISSSVNAELWGVYQGLQLAWRSGYVHVLLEVDSKRVLDMQNEEAEMDHLQRHLN